MKNSQIKAQKLLDSDPQWQSAIAVADMMVDIATEDKPSKPKKLDLSEAELHKVRLEAMRALL